METHPRLKQLDIIIPNNKIILGSFPTWSLTEPDPEKQETKLEKENLRLKNNDINFFYGSSTNNFWQWYRMYVDATIDPKNLEGIKENLRLRGIGITDIIYSCSRKGKSALDKHLTKRIYNHKFFIIPEKSQSVKILCTSKGVLNDMLLNKRFFDCHPSIKVNIPSSVEQQNLILAELNGTKNLITKPFFIQLECESGGKIECLSLPSPGSPFRKLDQFGKTEQSGKEYLNQYLEKAFKWFIK